MPPGFDPHAVGTALLIAFFTTVGLLAWAIKKSPRPEVPDWIVEEVKDKRIVLLRCARCDRTADVIMPTRCEGAVMIREIFTGQHRMCVNNDHKVTFP